MTGWVAPHRRGEHPKGFAGAACGLVVRNGAKRRVHRRRRSSDLGLCDSRHSSGQSSTLGEESDADCRQQWAVVALRPTMRWWWSNWPWPFADRHDSDWGAIPARQATIVSYRRRRSSLLHGAGYLDPPSPLQQRYGMGADKSHASRFGVARVQVRREPCSRVLGSGCAIRQEGPRGLGLTLRV